LKAIFTAVLGATFAGLMLTVIGLGWEQELPMWRERLFATTLNGVFAGWIAGLIVFFFGKRSAWRGLILGIACAVAPWSWFTAGFAIALVAVFWRREVPLAGLLPNLGIAAHLAPVIVYLVAPASWSVIPIEDAPPLSAAAEEFAAPPAGTADVLFVVCDTLRADAILDPSIPTPVMDGLRERGVWAASATAPANQTLPSHLSLLTGFDIEKIGMRGNLSPWPTKKMLVTDYGCKPLAVRFEEAGYRTAAVSTNTLLTEIPEADEEFMPFDLGFQTWHGLTAVTYWKTYMHWVRDNSMLGLIRPKAVLSWPMGHLLNPSARRTYRHHHREGERTTDSAITYLRELQQDERPYFLFAQYFDPHTPYGPPSGFAGTLATEDMVPTGFDSSPTSAFNMRVTLRDDVRGTSGLQTELDEQRSKYLHGIYAEEVAYFDQQLGRLLEAVEASGRPTIIAFTADHGEGFGVHGNVEHGESLYEEEVAVPFILVAPGLEPRQLDFMPNMIDNARTLLSLAGVNADGFDGIDVLAPDARPQPAMSFMIERVSMRVGDWKMLGKLRYDYDRSDEYAVPQAGEYTLEAEHLYNLADDPGELFDLLDVEKEKVKELEQMVRERMLKDALPDLPIRSFSPSELAVLRELGYI